MYSEKNGLFKKALEYSFPVFLGYSAIGIAFGLLLVDGGYPWYLAPIMSVIMYAGAAQYIAVGLFAAGAGLWEAALISLMVNARHLAYGVSMLKRYSNTGAFKPYLVYSLTDETFALLSALPEGDGPYKNRFMFYVSILNHCYWTLGGIVGALAGTLLPFNMKGLDFALTALFVVLMIEQFLRIRKAYPFIVSACTAIASVLFLPSDAALVSAMLIAIMLAGLPGFLTSAKDGSL